MRKVLTVLSLAVLLGACGSKNDASTTTTTTGGTGTTTTTTTTTPAKKSDPLAVMHAWGDAYQKGDWDKLKSLYAADAVIQAAGMPQTFKGADAAARFFKTFRASFPDMKAWPTHAFVKGDTVASIAMMKGTHTKPMMGMPATNKQVSFLGLDIVRIKDGKIVRQDLYADNYNFMVQLGMAKDPRVRPVWEGAEPTLVTAVSTDNATEKKNLATVDELLKHFNAHDAMKAIAQYTADAWLDDQSAPARVGGNGNILKEYKGLFAMFPDAALKDAKSWAAGDYVVTTYTFNGNNSGNVPGAPATNKTVNLAAASVFHLKDGKIANHAVFWDGAMFRMQLGILKFPGAPGPK